MPAPFLVIAKVPPAGLAMTPVKAAGAVAFCVLKARVLVDAPPVKVTARMLARSAVPNSAAPPTLKLAVRPLAMVVPADTRLAAVR